MSVFPRVVLSEMCGRMGPFDALVEVWNGVPWLSPVWCRKPNITFIHHVHGPMWNQVLPGPMAAVGRRVEASMAPPFYRRTRVVTPSESTRDELLQLGFRDDMVTAVNNGIDDDFSVGGSKAAEPTIVCVARMAPVKRHHLLVEAAVEARRAVPDLRLVLVGDGPTRPALEARSRAPSRRLGHLHRAPRPRPVGRAVPAGVDRCQRLARRGMGPVAHRGCSVRHAGRRHRHQWSSKQRHQRIDGRSRAARAAGIGHCCPADRPRPAPAICRRCSSPRCNPDMGQRRSRPTPRSARRGDPSAALVGKQTSCLLQQSKRSLPGRGAVV